MNAAGDPSHLATGEEPTIEVPTNKLVDPIKCGYLSRQDCQSIERSAALRDGTDCPLKYFLLLLNSNCVCDWELVEGLKLLGPRNRFVQQLPSTDQQALVCPMCTTTSRRVLSVLPYHLAAASF